LNVARKFIYNPAKFFETRNSGTLHIWASQQRRTTVRCFGRSTPIWPKICAADMKH